MPPASSHLGGKPGAGAAADDRLAVGDHRVKAVQQVGSVKAGRQFLRATSRMRPEVWTRPPRIRDSLIWCGSR